MKRLVLFLFLLAPATGFAQPYAIDTYKISGGGGASTGGVFTVTGTIGQADVGRMTGGNYAMSAGFWSIAVAVPTPGAPLLTITRSGNNLTLSWAADLGANFVLQENNNLSLTANWSTAAPPQGTNNNRATLVVPVSPGMKFYRLKK